MVTSKTKFSLIAVIAIVLGILIVIPNNTKAECPTPIDCPWTPFQSGGYRNIPLSETCTLRYEYCWRLACGYFYDVFIGSLELIGDCESYKQDIVNNLHIYLQYCADDVTLNVNPWGAPGIPECCPPSSSPCWSNAFFRQGSYACYSDFYWNPITQTWITSACDQENQTQCWNICRYCFYLEYLSNGNTLKKYNKDCQPVQWGEPCPATGGPNGDLPCHPVCD